MSQANGQHGAETEKSLEQRVHDLEMQNEALKNRINVLENSLTPDHDLEHHTLVDVTGQLEEILDHVSIPDGERLGQLLGLARTRALPDLHKEPGVSQVEADAVALYRAVNHNDVVVGEQLKTALTSLRDVDEDIQVTRVHRACERLEELSGGSVTFDKDQSGNRRLRQI